MLNNIVFKHYTRGVGRPQIVLVGNGLERKSGQPDWDELVSSITVNGCAELSKEQTDKIPFPLLYVLLSTPLPAQSSLSKEQIDCEEERLKQALKKLKNEGNDLYSALTQVGADHIFTTNYSYCLENTYWPNIDFSVSCARSHRRFNLNPEKKNGKQIKEVYYRLHSGYYAECNDGKKTGIWHIHGEVSSPKSVVIGHDRYGRLLSRIESVCSAQRYGKNNKLTELREFSSWPELFLYGDVYIIGFGFWECEFDLWWLLRRKQRERYSDGQVYFYDKNKGTDLRKQLLLAHGVELCEVGDFQENNFDEFYFAALEDIRHKISIRGSS